MNSRLHDWRDALCWRVVDEVFELEADPVEICRAFETDYYRLRSGKLIDARQEVIDAARYPWPIERADITPDPQLEVATAA